MNGRVIVRETAVSVAINAVLSAVFFLGVFGLSGPVPLRALGFDFLPQAFMVALMGSLVPGLLVRPRPSSPWPVARRALLFALAGLVLAGGGALLMCLTMKNATIAAGSALAIKVAFGAALALVVTPIAVKITLKVKPA